MSAARTKGTATGYLGNRVRSAVRRTLGSSQRQSEILHCRPDDVGAPRLLSTPEPTAEQGAGMPSKRWRDLGSSVDKALDAKWIPVDLYVGGAEHAVLHLLYARFWHKFLHDLGVVNHVEPFKRLVSPGVVLGEDHTKMSKSQGNVVNPDDVVAKLPAALANTSQGFRRHDGP